jgi:hypothetical protein
MQNLKMIFLAVALMVATAASAQFSFGIQGGGNLSNFLYSVDSDVVVSTSPKFGFNVGILTDFDFTPTMGIRSGLFFHTKGARAEIGPIEIATNLMYLQIPIHFAYKVDVTPGTRIVFHGGPYVAYGIGGRHDLRAGEWNISPDVAVFGSREEQYSPFDFGFGIGVGFEFGRFLTGIGVDMGIINISNADIESIRNQNAFLTVGYRF